MRRRPGRVFKPLMAQAGTAHVHSVERSPSSLPRTVVAGDRSAASAAFHRRWRVTWRRRRAEGASVGPPAGYGGLIWIGLTGLPVIVMPPEPLLIVHLSSAAANTAHRGPVALLVVRLSLEVVNCRRSDELV